VRYQDLLECTQVLTNAFTPGLDLSNGLSLELILLATPSCRVSNNRIGYQNYNYKSEHTVGRQCKHAITVNYDSSIVY